MSQPLARDHPFDADTAVTRIVDGRYAATVTDRWGLMSSGGFANGGYALAICLRAASAQLAHPDPLALSATYLSRVRFGPAIVEVDTVRTGRRVSTAEARLIQEGKEKVRVVATFGDLAERSAAGGRTEVRNAPPNLPPPEQCTALATREQVPGFTLADRVEFRYVELPGWRVGTPRGQLTDQFWMRLTPAADGTHREPDPIALAAMVDMATPPVIDLGERGSTTVELSVYVRQLPAPGWLACRVATHYVIDGLHEEDFEIWDSTGQLVAQSRQLAVLSERGPLQ